MKQSMIKWALDTFNANLNQSRAKHLMRQRQEILTLLHSNELVFRRKKQIAIISVETKQPKEEVLLLVQFISHMYMAETQS